MDLDHEKHPESRERGHKKGKNFHYLPLTKKPIEIKPNFGIQWSNKTTGDQAFVENWKDNNGKQIAILNTIDPAIDNGESLKNIRTDDKLELILKRPVFDMLQRKIIIIGFIAENEEGITFPIPASNLSIEQNNPGLYHLENQKFEFRFLGVDSLTNYPHFSILPELEMDLENLIEKNEVEAYVEKITVEKIYYSIIGDKNVIHSAKQPLSFVSEFISDLSVGEKVMLNIEYLVEYLGEVYIILGVESTVSSEDVRILEEFGIRVEENQLYCDEPISYEDLRKIQDLLPKRSSDLRRLYALSHQLNVRSVEIPKVFKALQKEALEIKNIVSVNGDQSRVKEMQKKIKSQNVRLSKKSYQIINNILNDAWNLSFLPGNKSFLKRQEAKLEGQEANLAKTRERLRNARDDSSANRVREWIAEDEYKISEIRDKISETRYKISNVKKEIEELENLLE